MSYEPTNWKSGDIVTSAKLNKLEQGVANSGGLPAVTSDDNGDVLTVVEGAWAKAVPSGGAQIVYIEHVKGDGENEIDSTWKSISDAISNEKLVLLYENNLSSEQEYGIVAIVTGVGIDNYNPDDVVYSVYPFFFSSGQSFTYIASAETDHPMRNTQG